MMTSPNTQTKDWVVYRESLLTCMVGRINAERDFFLVDISGDESLLELGDYKMEEFKPLIVPCYSGRFVVGRAYIERITINSANDVTVIFAGVYLKILPLNKLKSWVAGMEDHMTISDRNLNKFYTRYCV